MPDKDRQIVESLNNIIPAMTVLDRERLLGFGEGLAFAVTGKCAASRLAKRLRPAQTHKRGGVGEKRGEP